MLSVESIRSKTYMTEPVEQPEVPELDFDSDEPLPECPMRNNGDDICEACQ